MEDLGNERKEKGKDEVPSVASNGLGVFAPFRELTVQVEALDLCPSIQVSDLGVTVQAIAITNDDSESKDGTVIVGDSPSRLPLKEVVSGEDGGKLLSCLPPVAMDVVDCLKEASWAGDSVKQVGEKFGHVALAPKVFVKMPKRNPETAFAASRSDAHIPKELNPLGEVGEGHIGNVECKSVTEDGNAKVELEKRKADGLGSVVSEDEDLEEFDTVDEEDGTSNEEEGGSDSVEKLIASELNEVQGEPISPPLIQVDALPKQGPGLKPVSWANIVASGKSPAHIGFDGAKQKEWVRVRKRRSGKKARKQAKFQGVSNIVESDGFRDKKKSKSDVPLVSQHVVRPIGSVRARQGRSPLNKEALEAVVEWLAWYRDSPSPAEKSKSSDGVFGTKDLLTNDEGKEDKQAVPVAGASLKLANDGSDSAILEISVSKAGGDGSVVVGDEEEAVVTELDPASMVGDEVNCSRFVPKVFDGKKLCDVACPAKNVLIDENICPVSSISRRMRNVEYKEKQLGVKNGGSSHAHQVFDPLSESKPLPATGRKASGPAKHKVYEYGEAMASLWISGYERRSSSKVLIVSSGQPSPWLLRFVFPPLVPIIHKGRLIVFFSRISSGFVVVIFVLKAMSIGASVFGSAPSKKIHQPEKKKPDMEIHQPEKKKPDMEHHIRKMKELVPRHIWAETFP
ncbi:hypothetical protein U1Q18_040900 [Sarracenia purpurea var. burkii]